MASLGGGIKAVVVATGVVGERVFRDNAPADTATPYCTFSDYLGDVSVLDGDGAETIARRRIAQVDLWFGSRAEEADATIRTLKAALDGAEVAADDGKVLKVKVANVIRRWSWDADDVSYILDLRATYLPAAV
jgi:uncharacterized protein DUF3168